MYIAGLHNDLECHQSKSSLVSKTLKSTPITDYGQRETANLIDKFLEKERVTAQNKT